MMPIYQEALNGTLKSPSGGASVSQVSFQNNTPIPVNVYWLSGQGMRVGIDTGLGNGPTINPGQATVASGRAAYVGHYYLVTAANSGAFMGVLTIVAGQSTYVIDASILPKPNDIGSIPQPGKWTLIPTDSPRVMVSFGKLAGKTQPGSSKGYDKLPVGTSITREQFWQRQADSYSLAPGEIKTVSYTSTSGKEKTSSEELTIAASLGLSASASWGAVSASMSASLSASSTTSQQIAITEESSSFLSHELENPYTQPGMFLRWQLVDVVTIYQDAFTDTNPSKTNSAPIAATITNESPGLVTGPFNLHTFAPLATLINCGSSQVVGGFLQDSDFSQGLMYSVNNVINTELIPTPVPPMAVYQTCRFGSGGNNSFTYTITALEAGANYLVTLHFADLVATQAEERQFNVVIGTTTVLSNFDIVGEAGAQFKAIAKPFTVPADSGGNIEIQFNAIADSYTPIVNAIVVQPTLTPEAQARRRAAGRLKVKQSAEGEQDIRASQLVGVGQE